MVYLKTFTSKATKWGKNNEPIPGKTYLEQKKKSHAESTVSESGFVMSQIFLFIGESPDGIIKCRCHFPGLLNMKCP